MDRPRVMVTGAGGPGAVNLSRSLLSIRPQPWILAVDASPWYVHLALGHERALVPRCSDRVPYLEQIGALCRAHDIDVILPNNSLEIAALSGTSDALPARTFLPEPEVLAIADSKWASWQVWSERGVPVPATRLLQSPKDVEAAFRDLRSSPDEAVWVRGAGIPGKGIGVASLPCRTVDQAVQWVEYWRGWGGMIASEFLPGDNLTWLGLFDRGRLVASQGRQRDAYVIPHVSPSGITGAPAVSHTICDPDVNALGEAAVRALDADYHGVGFVDMKCDGDGRPRVTELNAGRFGTTHYFYTAAGANFPEMLLRLALGEDLDVPPHDLLPPDLYWIRTLDAGPVLLTREAMESAEHPVFEPGDGRRWPLVPQNMADFPAPEPPTWRGGR